MDDSIGEFCKTLALVCNNLESSCRDLKDSVDCRPIPLDSASASFLRSLNGRVSSLTADLNVLDTMSCGTVSFEELLGHCQQLFNQNQTSLLSLQDHLRDLGYVISEEEEEEDDDDDPLLEDLSPDCSKIEDNPLLDELNLHHLGLSDVDLSPELNKIEDDPLLDDLNLHNLGISDLSLATIASKANKGINDEGLDGFNRKMNEELKLSEDVIIVSEDDYENLPKILKSLASWQELVVAVEKMNSFLRTKSTRPYSFQQCEITELGLGHKARSYLLLLIRMDRVIVETINGLICYRIL